MGLRDRVRRLEARTPRPAPASLRSGPTTLDEIRVLEADIRRLEAGMDPDELRKSRAQDAVLDGRLQGLELDEKIAAVEREIEILEAGGG